MPKPEHIEILKAGIETWNRWRRENPLELPDLSYVELQWQRLNGFDFSSADLTRADFTGAGLSSSLFCEAKLSNAKLAHSNLSRANLSKAILSYANIQIADLINVDLSEANLRGADLTGANLKKAKLISTNLEGTNFRNAILDETIFNNLKLNKAINLDECIHHGPSYIDVTSLNSLALPSVFLEGCRLRNSEAELSQLYPLKSELSIKTNAYASTPLDEHHPKLTSYHSCFISYSSQDKAFVGKLIGDLQSSGVKCWYDEANMKIGDKIAAVIYEAIGQQNKLLLILSKNSVLSDWVGHEVRVALNQEKERGTNILFPIRIDNDIENYGVNWAARIIKGRHVGDFRNWANPVAYSNALIKLLSDLRICGKVEASFD